jgi:hypothetical protein
MRPFDIVTFDCYAADSVSKLHRQLDRTGGEHLTRIEGPGNSADERQLTLTQRGTLRPGCLPTHPAFARRGRGRPRRALASLCVTVAQESPAGLQSVSADPATAPVPPTVAYCARVRSAVAIVRSDRH